ncbi:MAG: mechanosensitive ion channel family protein [Akkermansiaceae bacterium]
MANAQKIITDSLSDIWKSFLEHLPFLAGALAIIVFTWLVATAVTRLAKRTLGKTKMRPSLVQLVVRLIKTSIWIFGFISAAMIVFPGLTPAKALSAAGLVSVAVGLAFKDIFQNFFAGVMLLWKFPFEEDDLISCGDVTGRVKKIELRHTLIQDTSGELIILPNSLLVTQPVEVFTHISERRIELDVGVSYDTDLEHATKVITEAVASLQKINQDRGTKILPVGFGASSIDFKIFAWTNSQPMPFREATAEMIATVKKALDEADIEIPFPYRTLTFKEPLQTMTNESQE